MKSSSRAASQGASRHRKTGQSGSAVPEEIEEPRLIPKPMKKAKRDPTGPANSSGRQWFASSGPSMKDEKRLRPRRKRRAYRRPSEAGTWARFTSTERKIESQLSFLSEKRWKSLGDEKLEASAPSKKRLLRRVWTDSKLPRGRDPPNLPRAKHSKKALNWEMEKPYRVPLKMQTTPKQSALAWKRGFALWASTPAGNLIFSDWLCEIFEDFSAKFI